MKIMMNPPASFVWAELSKIYQKTINNVSHSSFIVTAEFTQHPFADLYREKIEDMLKVSLLFLNKLEDLQRCSASTSKKIGDYCLFIQNNKSKTNDLLTQLSQQMNSNLTPINSEPANVFEKREAGECDLLTLLNQQSNKNNT